MNQTRPGITALEPRISPTRLDRRVDWFSRHWVLIVGIILGLYAGLPFLAPVFMNFGWESPARMIYFIYSFQCHQLPQRSFFLFGPRTTYSLAEIQSLSPAFLDPLSLRHFVGNPEMGWKIAWSDRMVAMFASLWFFAMVWRPLRRRLPPLPWWGLLLLLLPLALDGSSHLMSDLAGIGQGFRDNNAWLSILSQQAFSPAFYAGDAWGSFNSIMRLITGVLFGIGVVWFSYPYFEDAFSRK